MLVLSFSFALATLIMPLKMITFSIHNSLTKRDYSYSIDDLGDLALAVCVGIWVYTYIWWSDIEN